MQSYQRFQCIGHTDFKGLSNAVTNTHSLLPSMGTTRQKSSCRNRLQNGPRLLSRAKVGTHSAFGERSHTRAHTAKQGTFRMGALLLPSERSTRFGNPAWPGFKTANFAPFGSRSRVLPKNAESLRDSDAHDARRCSEGVAAPLGCVIFSLLSKLRPVRPIPETSFSSPDAPACAVSVQATSQLVSFRLEADRGFSVLSLCLTSFFDFGDKKRPPTLCAHGAGQRSDFQYSGC